MEDTDDVLRHQIKAANRKGVLLQDAVKALQMDTAEIIRTLRRQRLRRRQHQPAAFSRSQPPIVT